MQQLKVLESETRLKDGLRWNAHRAVGGKSVKCGKKGVELCTPTYRKHQFIARNAARKSNLFVCSNRTTAISPTTLACKVPPQVAGKSGNNFVYRRGRLVTPLGSCWYRRPPRWSSVGCPPNSASIPQSPAPACTLE